MAGWECKKEVVPFSAMAAIEIVTVVLSTMYKAAAAKGLSYFVLITYSSAIGALFFLPLLFIFPRSRTAGLQYSVFKLPIFSRFVLLAFIGYAASVCAYKGIDYTSPTIASCISNLVPAFTFVFAVVFRMESLDFRGAKTQAKTLGTIVSISGASVTILYKGPVILSSKTQASSFLLEHSLRSSDASWVLGGVLLVGLCLFYSLAFIVQTQIIKLYPSELTVGVVASLFTSIVAAIFGAIVEKNKIAWTLRTDMALLTVALTGLLGSSLTTAVHTWGLDTKGPVYVSIFKPFSIVIAAVMGVVFLGDALYLGSVIGAAIILVGFYAVLWGKTEEKDQGQSYAYDGKTPLLTT